MKEEKRALLREKLEKSTIYRKMEQVQTLMDEYYIDGVIGLIPYGIGDIISAVFSMIYVWFAFVKIKSIPLTLAVLNNALRDVVLGLIPFYVGDVIDFFHRANRQNMQLVRGFVQGDESVIRAVNRKAIQSGVFIVVFLLAIVALLWSLVALTQWILSLISFV